MVLFGSILNSWRSPSSHESTLNCFGLYAALGEGAMHLKSSCSYYPLKRVQSQIFLLQQCAETSLDAGLPQSLSCMWVIIEVSVLHGLQDCSQEGLELVHRPVQGLTLEPKSGCQWPNAPVDKTPPGSFGTWCWITQFPQRHFCS